MASPTAALFWAACRPSPSRDDVRAAIDAGADLDAAANHAVAQRVSPLLWRALDEAGCADATTQWATTLRRDAARCHAQSRMVLPRIGELFLTPLAAAGFEPLIIKGAALVDRYPDPGLRPMDDVDVVLPRTQIDDAAATLLAAGWTHYLTPARQRHEAQFTHPAFPGLHVDLHRSLGTWRNRSNRLTTDELWSARVATTLAGAPAFVLPPALEFVMLAAHAGKPWHAFDRLIWIVDLAVAARAGMDWDAVARIATQARCETAVAVGLTQVRHLGVDSPAALRHIDAPWRTHALAELLSDEWPTTSHTVDRRARVRYALVDERATRAALALAELTSKTVWSMPRRTYWMLRRTVRQNVERRGAKVS